jgi:protease I
VSAPGNRALPRARLFSAHANHFRLTQALLVDCYQAAGANVGNQSAARIVGLVYRYSLYRGGSIEMTKISDARILIISDNGFEQSELEVPRDRLKEAGAKVTLATPGGQNIKGWEGKDWGREVSSNATLENVDARDFDALVIPGGQMNPDLLRVNVKAVALVKAFAAAGKPIAAVCHAPWLLVEAGILMGRKATSYKSIRTDVINAGADWQDSEVVVDQGIITSRSPDDLPAFVAKIIEEIEEGRHDRYAAA